MRSLPLPDPGTAEVSSPGRFLWWMAKGQLATLAGGMFFGIVWAAAQAVMPAALGRAIDTGVAGDDSGALLTWAGVMLAIGLVQAGAGIMRHRFAVTNWLTAAYRTVQLVGRQSVRLGSSLPRKVPTGEVVTIGTSDLSHLGQVMDVSARFTGAIVSFILVAVILLNTSLTLGLVVLLGLPLLMTLVGPLLQPLQRRTAHQRQLMGDLSNTATDIVSGLRVLRGIGGERVFAERYRRDSQATRAAGVRVAGVQSVLDALQVFLPGVFVVLVVWIGARQAATGAVTPGELVAFYGYAAFLVLPLRTVTEYANKFVRARVSAARVCRVLAAAPDHTDPVAPVPAPGGPADLHDAATGFTARAGLLTAVVCEDPDRSADLADRLGGIGVEPDPGVTWGGVRLVDLAHADLRRSVLVSDSAAALFSGRLAERLDPTGRGDVAAALEAASAGDVLEALPDGLDTVVTERGRSFSGGQRQRLVLARALSVDPDVLVLVEPTSAVDAHTEARIADRLHRFRAGRTTVVTTTSPLLLDSANEVALLGRREGRWQVLATGTHADLLDHPVYRVVVTRENAEEVAS